MKRTLNSALPQQDAASATRTGFLARRAIGNPKGYSGGLTRQPNYVLRQSMAVFPGAAAVLDPPSGLHPGRIMRVQSRKGLKNVSK